MANLFYKLGRMIGPKLRQANWILRSLTGTEAETIQAEVAVGRDLAGALAQQMEVDQEPAIVEMVNDIGQQLGKCVKDRQRRFAFRVVRSPEINAFALPGGFIFVTRSLLQLCHYDPQETAFVLGHEMG